MADFTPGENFQRKSFFKRPEGVTGMIFGIGILGALGYLLYSFMPVLIAAAANTLYLVGMLVALAAIIYMIVDPRMRNLIWYSYKSVMRWITGLFVQIDPIGVLKSYVDDLRSNLRKMSKQIGILRGEMRKMQGLVKKNDRDIQQSLKLAAKAKEQGNSKQIALNTRKAARLKETNAKYTVLHKKMSIMNRVLEKMYQNAEILLEDTKDQVQLKEQERKVIRASHSAMKSAMNIISGKGDKKEMFDMALEAMADDISGKIGEMERFMDVSANFMDSVDLQNGIFEDEGLKMLEAWEKESDSLLLGDDKQALLNDGSVDGYLDLNAPTAEREKLKGDDNQYDQFFE